MWFKGAFVVLAANLPVDYREPEKPKAWVRRP